MDWKVVAAAPLVIENQLPIKATYLVWETPKVSEAVLLHTQSHQRALVCMNSSVIKTQTPTQFSSALYLLIRRSHNAVVVW